MDRLFWPMLIASVLASLLICCESRGAECPAVALKRGEAVSQNCRVFTVRREGDKRVIEYKGKQEVVNCSKAKQDPFGGWWDYYPRIVSTRIWCQDRKGN